MHTRRLVAFLLGAWLGGILFVTYTAYANSYTTKGIIEHPTEAPRRLTELSGSDRVASLLRYQTAELNRSMIESWEWMQLALGLAVIITLPFAMRLKWAYVLAAIVMFGIVLAQRTLLTPEMIGVGRLLDMAGGNAWTQDDLWKERQSMHTLEQLYISLDAVKVLFGLSLTGALLIFRQKTSGKRTTDRRLEKVNAVDDSDYSHING